MSVSYLIRVLGRKLGIAKTQDGSEGLMGIAL